MNNPVCERKVELVLTDTDGEMSQAIKLSQKDIEHILSGLSALPNRMDSIIGRVGIARRWLSKKG